MMLLPENRLTSSAAGVDHHTVMIIYPYEYATRTRLTTEPVIYSHASPLFTLRSDDVDDLVTKLTP